jgi:hypothetical protein
MNSVSLRHTRSRTQATCGVPLGSEHWHWNQNTGARLGGGNNTRREIMGFGKGALLWLIGIPLPIIILLALFWR